MTDETNKETLDAEIQDVDTSVDNEGNDTLNESNDSASSDGSDSDEKYLNAKKRAEIAEGKLKELKNSLAGDNTEEKVQTKTEQTGLSREETILFAQGLSEKEVDKAIRIAKIEEISLTEAVQGDFFKTWKKTNEDKIKSEKAQLGTSKGSQKTAEKKSFDTPNISGEDHKALFREKMGR